MKKRISLFTITDFKMRGLCLILLACCSIASAQVRKGKWYAKEITIYHNEARNLSLEQLNIKAFTCNEDGGGSAMGRCVRIENLSKDTLYYRNAPLRYYQSKKDMKSWEWSPANVLTYYPIPPGSVEIICAQVYEDAHIRILPCEMIAEFRFFVPDVLDKSKKVMPVNKDQPVPVSPKTGNNTLKSSGTTGAFYLFFTTDINVKPKESQFSGLLSPKVLTVISKPMLYRGNVRDLMISEKEAFIDQIVEQIPTLPEKYKQILKEDNYKAVNVYCAKMYSNVLLKTEKEGLEAIAAYKQDWYDMTEGLSLANSKEFYHLK